MVRSPPPGGRIFVRDLLRPADTGTLDRLVNQYAAGANDHQRTMFADSLRAALTLAEIRLLVAGLGMNPDRVQATSDRHWTWSDCNRPRSRPAPPKADRGRKLSMLTILESIGQFTAFALRALVAAPLALARPREALRQVLCYLYRRPALGDCRRIFRRWV